MKREAKVMAAVIALVVPVILVATAGAATARQNGKIVFRRYFDQEHSWGAVFTVNPDGSAARQVTHPQKGVVDDTPRWAPDGSLIAFSRCAPSGPCHIWAVAPDGTGLGPVGPLCPAGATEETCADDANASFSPDSERLVFTQATGAVRNDSSGEDWIEHSALALMNRDGSARRVLYQGARFGGDLNDPVFSPDGKRLAFGRHVSGFSKPAGHKAMYVINVDGTHLRRLTPWAENDGDHPAWSPNGRWLLFHSHVEDPSGQSQIILIHPDGSGRKQLTHFADGTWVGRSSFSPDGRSIVFSDGPESANAGVYTMRLDGSHVRRITHSSHWDSAPDWGPLT
jgi:TolB protein